MKDKNKISTEKIADFLKEIMKEKNLNANKILIKAQKNDIKLSTQQLYSVLKMGRVVRENYTIETFLNVLSLIGIHIEFHDLAEKKQF